MNFSTIRALRREQIIYVFLKVCLGRHAASVHQITKNRRQVNQRKDKVFPKGGEDIMEETLMCRSNSKQQQDSDSIPCEA